MQTEVPGCGCELYLFCHDQPCSVAVSSARRQDGGGRVAYILVDPRNTKNWEFTSMFRVHGRPEALSVQVLQLSECCFFSLNCCHRDCCDAEGLLGLTNHLGSFLHLTRNATSRKERDFAFWTLEDRIRRSYRASICNISFESNYLLLGVRSHTNMPRVKIAEGKDVKKSTPSSRGKAPVLPDLDAC